MSKSFNDQFRRAVRREPEPEPQPEPEGSPFPDGVWNGFPKRTAAPVDAGAGTGGRRTYTPPDSFNDAIRGAARRDR
jgi:hypothetical protein